MDEQKKIKIFDEMSPNRAEQRKLTVRHILEQRHSGNFAIIDVIRKERSVTISWEFWASVKNPSNFKVMGIIREMKLIPDPSYDADGYVADTHGNGSVQLELEEGCSYYFEFLFANVKDLEKADETKEIKEYMDIVYFQVAVPMSNASKALFKKAAKIVHDPKENARHESGKYLDLLDTFDNELKNGVERIKQKKLSEEEEEDQIEQFKEHIAMMKEHLRM
jgi:hypothetical protein